MLKDASTGLDILHPHDGTVFAKPGTPPKPNTVDVRPDVSVCTLDSSHLILQTRPAIAAEAICAFAASLPGSD